MADKMPTSKEMTDMINPITIRIAQRAALKQVHSLVNQTMAEMPKDLSTRQEKGYRLACKKMIEWSKAYEQTLVNSVYAQKQTLTDAEKEEINEQEAAEVAREKEEGKGMEVLTDREVIQRAQADADASATENLDPRVS